MLFDPQLDVARRQATHFLQDRKHSIGEDVHPVHEAFNARGVGQSTMAKQSVARNIRAELIARYQFIWKVYSRFLQGNSSQNLTSPQRNTTSATDLKTP